MKRVVSLEAEALKALASFLDAPAADAARAIFEIQGRVICTGVGKSGHVARKIAATLASTGTPAQFVHPSEASHGDLGMITQQDLVLALSKSGETHELGDLLAYCRRFGVPVIALTAGHKSALSNAADIVLLVPQIEEACGETRAPTTSTTVMMAYGDALAVALIEMRGFNAQAFRRFHPGGALGAALAKAEDVMHPGAAMPLVLIGTPMSEALIEMSAKGFGCVGVVDRKDLLTGIVTDGDLRRKMSGDITAQAVENVMTSPGMDVPLGTLAADALRLMTSGPTRITSLFVCDEERCPVGILHIHDLLKIGLA
ncbi:MAG: KpsF/GutQ family sugar-phosphate isomerase [Oceanicaulis sp.]|nr:KpsF/GutQ family sugar-phosphate isomerase [Oceanicaulis sp.]